MGYCHQLRLFTEVISDAAWFELKRKIGWVVYMFKNKYPEIEFSLNHIDDVSMAFNFTDATGGYESIGLQKNKKFYDGDMCRFNGIKTGDPNTTYDLFVRVVLCVISHYTGGILSSDGGIEVFDQAAKELKSWTALVLQDLKYYGRV